MVGSEHAGKKAGSKLDINTADHTDNQRWLYTSSKTIQHKLSGLCMSIGETPPPSPPPTPAIPASPSLVVINDSIIATVDPEYLSLAYDTAAWLGIPWEGKGPVTAPNLQDPFLRRVVSHLAPARLRIGGGAGDCQLYMQPPANKTFLSDYCKSHKYYNYGVREKEFEALAEFIRATNLSLVFGLNDATRTKGGSWDPTNAALLLGLPSACEVDTFELGNEIRAGKLDKVPTAAEYGADFLTLAALIRQKCKDNSSRLPGVAGTDQDPGRDSSSFAGERY
jgi:hypothetical protein